MYSVRLEWLDGTKATETVHAMKWAGEGLWLRFTPTGKFTRLVPLAGLRLVDVTTHRD